MRLIAPYFFVFIGVFTGLLMAKLYRQGFLEKLTHAIVGIAGSFCGLFAYDVLNLDFGSNLIGTIIGAVFGAIFLVVALQYTIAKFRLTAR